MDSTIIDWALGLPKGMRLKDFPSFIRTTDPDDAMLTLTLHSTECQRSVPSAVVFHTFEELESQVISAMSDILPPIYAMGPLPLLLREACASAGPCCQHVGGLQPFQGGPRVLGLARQQASQLGGVHDLREPSETDQRAIGGARLGTG